MNKHLAVYSDFVIEYFIQIYQSIWVSMPPITGIGCARRNSLYCSSQICGRGIQGWSRYKVCLELALIKLDHWSYHDPVYFQRNHHRRRNRNQPPANCRQRVLEAWHWAETDTEGSRWRTPLVLGGCLYMRDPLADGIYLRNGLNCGFLNHDQGSRSACASCISYLWLTFHYSASPHPWCIQFHSV